MGSDIALDCRQAGFMAGLVYKEHEAEWVNLKARESSHRVAYAIPDLLFLCAIEKFCEQTNISNKFQGTFGIILDKSMRTRIT